MGCNCVYVPKLIKIESIKEIATDEYIIRVNHKAKHDPGQFYQLSVLGIGEAPISICSYNEKYTEFLIRAVGNVTNKICSMKKNDKIALRGPYGHGYPMENMKANTIILIGGGSGVAPLRGVIEYLEKNRSDFNDIITYFGFRNPEEILFKEDMKKWDKTLQNNVTVDKGSKGYKGNVGLVTALLDNSGLDNKNKVVVTCGPPVMIKFVIQSLKKLGFNDDQIYVSFERHMKCGVGKCGHCMVHGHYACKHGPVFRYDGVKEHKDGVC